MALNDQTLQYVRMLEQRLMEHEVTTGINSRNTNNESMAPNPILSSSNKTSASNSGHNENNNNNNKASENASANDRSSNDILSGRPEAVVRALQILEVREQLERERVGNSTSMSPEHMDDGEKALLREMCNVVWRKLEEPPQ